MKHTRILKPPAAAIGVLMLLAPPLWASECMRLCNPQFMQDASPSDIRAEIDRGANINGRDDNLNTPLHFASFWGNDAAMRALLAAGADPNINTESGLTLLHLAANAQTVQLAVQAGLDIHARARNGQTPLHVASRWGNTNTIMALLAAGANPETSDNAGRRPGDLAVLNPNLDGTDIVQRLEKTQQ